MKCYYYIYYWNIFINISFYCRCQRSVWHTCAPDEAFNVERPTIFIVPDRKVCIQMGQEDRHTGPHGHKSLTRQPDGLLLNEILSS